MDKKQLEKEVKNITRQLIEKYKPEKIILFGSAARGEFGQDSDLDFLIIKDDERRYLEIEQEIHEAINYQIASDFFLLRPREAQYRLKHGDFFLKEIFEQGRILYG